jgi:type IV secretion system protein VirB11
MNQETLARNLEYLRRKLGDSLQELMLLPSITEIMVNPDGSIWAQAYGGEKCDSATREAIITAVAGLLGTTATREHPIVQGELPFSRHRFHGVLPPVSEGPMFVIRKHDAQHLTINDYVQAGIITPQQAEILYDCILKQDTILISGGTASGKTTLANALLSAIAGGDPVRLVVIEDTRELQWRASNVVSLRTSEHVTLRDLVKASLRLNPDRIIVGEVRGAEALDLLKAWNTGHRGGVSTIHANSVADVYVRLQTLVAEADGYTLPPALFATAINILIHIEFDGQVRRVREMVRVVPSGSSFSLVSLT